VPNITQAEITTLATIVAAESLGKLKANTVLARIVNRNYDNEVAERGKIVSIPFRGALTVNDKVANTAVALQSPSDSAVNVTLDKHKHVSFLIEDPARAMASYDALSGYMGDAVLGIAEQIDSDIAALYAGFSQTIDASAGLAESHYRRAQRLLNAAKAPQSGRWAVLHQDAFYESQAIEKVVSTIYRGEDAESALREGQLGQFCGFQVVLDQQIVTATTRKNLFIHRDAAVLVTRPLPVAPAGMGVVQTVMQEDGVSLRVTLSYSRDHLGMQVTVDVLYGVAELRDAFGVTVSTAANPA
jgi:hypothetical protein